MNNNWVYFDQKTMMSSNLGVDIIFKYDIRNISGYDNFRNNISEVLLGITRENLFDKAREKASDELAEEAILDAWEFMNTIVMDSYMRRKINEIHYGYYYASHQRLSRLQSLNKVEAK